MNKFKVKICGLTNTTNLVELSLLKPDFFGLVFVPGSSRAVTEEQGISLVKQVQPSTQKIGVFVREDFSVVSNIVKKCNLDYVQLHGGENLNYIIELKTLLPPACKIIKVFNVDDTFSLDSCAEFEQQAEFFLFDSGTKGQGGTGKRFNWEILQNYSYQTPYLLAGGVGLEDISALRENRPPGLIGVDISSNAEIYPGIKSPDLVQKIIKAARE